MTCYRVQLFVLLIPTMMACSEPKCPANLIQQGTVCKRCPEGSEKRGNQCIDVDSGEGVGTTDVSDEAPTDLDEDEGGSAGSAEDHEGGAGAQDASADSDDAPCYEDMDGDGIGAGPAVECNHGDSIGLHQSRSNTDCDDNEVRRSPRLTDICGDDIDNDCDGMADNESNNACGGPCTVQLSHQPGEECDNGMVGPCKRVGKFECTSGSETACNAPIVQGSPEVCGDDVDNDCDGRIDEADAVDAITWFQDCDGDGYSPSVQGSVKSCAKPAGFGTCESWTNVIPSEQTKSNWDCDDSRVEYTPGADYGDPPQGSTSMDLDCNGVLTPAPDYAERTMTALCLSSTISKMNSDSRFCPSGPCYAWKDENGRWTRVPVVTCPDTPYYIYYHDGLGTCIHQARTSLYKCK